MRSGSILLLCLILGISFARGSIAHASAVQKPEVVLMEEGTWGVEIEVRFPPYEDVVSKSSDLEAETTYKTLSIGLDRERRPVPSHTVTLVAPQLNGNGLQIIDAVRIPVAGFEPPGRIPVLSNLFPPDEPLPPGNDQAWLEPAGTFRGRPLIHLVVRPLRIESSGRATWLESIRLRVRFRAPISAGDPSNLAGGGTNALLWDRLVANPGHARVVGRALSPAPSRSPNAPEGFFPKGDGWIRIEVSQTGMYRLVHSDLSRLGLDLDSINPATFRLFSSGFRRQPRSLQDTPASWESGWSMTEHAIWVAGESDGLFDPGDTLSFWAIGPEEWTDYSDVSASDSLFQSHDWDDVTVVWLTWGGTFSGPVKRMGTRTPGITGGGTNVDLHRARLHMERNNLVSLSGADDGYAWRFMEGTGAATYTFSFDPDHPVKTSNPVVIKTKMDAVWKSDNNSHRVIYSLNGSDISGEIAYDPTTYPNLEDRRIATVTADSLVQGLNTFGVTLTRTADPNDAMVFSWFDVFYDARLRAADGVLDFFDRSPPALKTYSLDGFGSGSVLVFDVTDFSDPVRLGEFVLSGGAFAFDESLPSSPVHYVAVRRDRLAEIPAGSIRLELEPPADLRGLTEGPHMVIVAPREFRAAADRLAQHRRQKLWGVQSPRVLRVDVEDIYANFSGGMIDPNGIRNFIKYLYEEFRESGEPVLQYVTILGDATYDFLNVTGRGFNFVPIYLDLNPKSSFKVESIISDDWFVKMDPVDNNVAHDLPDIAIGRILARSSQEAQEMVDRIIEYESVDNLGTWRSRVVMAADDRASNPGDNRFVVDTDVLGAVFMPDALDEAKIYMDEYELRGGVKPDATRDFVDAWNDGAVFLSYMGHGGPEVMADENLFLIGNVAGLRNGTRLPLVVTLSCTIGKFDDPFVTSMGEALLAQDNGGGVMMLAATRLTFHLPNLSLAQEYLDLMFPGPIGDKRLGAGVLPPAWALVLAKQVRGAGTNTLGTIENNEKYFHLGDAAANLVFPSLEVRFTGSTADTLVSARPKTVTGEVYRAGTLATDFNGTVELAVWDTGVEKFQPGAGNYSLPGDRIFEGSVDVTGGLFSATFYVPLKPRFGSRGRIRAYVSSGTVDGVGATDTVLVRSGGPAPGPNLGGPDLRLAFENEAQSVKANAVLRGELEDPEGISILGSLPQNSILLEFDDNGLPIDVTERFQYYAGSYTEGAFSYPLPTGFEVGDHKVILTAADNLGASSKDTLLFSIIEEQRFEITQVINFPNPFREETDIAFELSDPADIEVKVFTTTGREIRRLSVSGVRGKNVVHWDGRDERGDAVANGVYLYRLDVRYRGQNTAPNKVYGTMVRAK